MTAKPLDQRQERRHAMRCPPGRRAAVVLAYFDARGRGDVDVATSAFDEKAFMIGAAPQGLCSLASPCYDRASIRANVEVLAKIPHLCETVTPVEVVGSFIFGRVEVRHGELR